jgi:copper oxidase (laccase) domain-containing protein
MDITKENLKQLIKRGVKRDNILVSEVDTYKSPDYFSFRRSKSKKEKEGRFATILGIR